MYTLACGLRLAGSQAQVWGNLLRAVVGCVCERTATGAAIEVFNDTDVLEVMKQRDEQNAACSQNRCADCIAQPVRAVCAT